MQPLISPVDHESRYNSYRADDSHDRTATESTPLLHRFPHQPTSNRTSYASPTIICFLVTVLLLGIVIGIYLLIIQSNSEHVLPPSESPLQLVTRLQWDYNITVNNTGLVNFVASNVIVVQTDTRSCYTTQECGKLLREMQAYYETKSLPYNFLVSSGGRCYEGAGWWKASPLYPEYNALVLGFIGDFTSAPPVQQQVEAAKKIIVESLSERHLVPDYVIFGKKTKYKPIKLFQTMQTLPKWNSKLTD